MPVREKVNGAMDFGKPAKIASGKKPLCQLEDAGRRSCHARASAKMRAVTNRTSREYQVLQVEIVKCRQT